MSPPLSEFFFRGEPASVGDFRELARRRLPRPLFDYVDGGAYEESTMSANCSDLSSIRLRQRVMTDVSKVSLATSVLGTQLAMPVVLGPVGLAGMLSPRAEVAAARAAQEAGIAFCESTVSICGVEEVTTATSQPPWFQLYVMRDRSNTERLIAKAAAANCPVLVLTVDLAVVGARYRDVRNGITQEFPSLSSRAKSFLDLAAHPRWLYEVGIKGKPHTFGNLLEAVPGATRPVDFRSWVDTQLDPSVTWEDVGWIKEIWPGKLLIKGILDPEDAKKAVDAGADGIVVSNHGGRQLDSTPSTTKAIEAIVHRVGDKTEVLFDGGVRSGLDVLKAIALGARACLLGRSWAWAVAALGHQGVSRCLRSFNEEMRVAMSLTGVTSVDAIDKTILI